jgi:hypothetical protein
MKGRFEQWRKAIGLSLVGALSLWAMTALGLTILEDGGSPGVGLGFVVLLYLSTATVIGSASSIRELSRPPMRGRVFIEAVGPGSDRIELHALYQAMPSNVRASNSYEAGTTVVVRCSEVAAGTYSDGYSQGFQPFCTVTVKTTDRAGKRLESMKKFSGTAPPHTITKRPGERARAFGTMPTRQIASWLQSYPKA